MTREDDLNLTRVSPSSISWYVSVFVGWPLIVVGIVHIFTTPVIDLAPAFVMTAALAVLLELLPLVQGRGHDPEGVVMSTAFVIALLFIWGPWPAILMVAIGSLCSDTRKRKDWWKILFNPSQYAVSVAIASLVMLPFTSNIDLATPLQRFHITDLAWMVGCWIVYFLVNNTLVAGVISYDSSFGEMFFEDFSHAVLMTFAVLALSPLIVVVGIAHWPLMPLLLIPLLLLYRSARIGVEREHAAGHDALTGLPNRATLQFEMVRAFTNHQRDGSPFALMLIDLNDFKRINDTLGHQVGDALLVEFARRLESSLRPGDSVARLGGDEFAVLVYDVDAAAARYVAERICATVTQTMSVDGLTLEINLSLGIALCPEHGVDGTTLLRRADVAMYSAKERSSGIELYSSDRDENSADRLELLGELRQALTDGSVELHYQPKVVASDSTPVGVEALVRWRHPDRGFVPPDEFIPLAERSGVMPLLTAHVVELALMQTATWRDAGITMPVAVNVSPTDLVGDELPDAIARRLATLSLDPSLLILEITERMVTFQPEEATRTLNRLRALGVRVSLDDFGTGYSSLARLSSLPVDEIKIDRTFVSSMTRTDSGVSIVQAMVDLAHALELPAVAEGVETADEWRLLTALGCDGVQGWQVARPMPAADATAWICARLDVVPLRHTAPDGAEVPRMLEGRAELPAG